MKKRKCKNPTCPKDYFYPSRIDQIFCCTKCRNQYNNHAYKLRNEPYKTISKDLKQQDEELETLLKSNHAVLINYDKLAAYSVKIERAKTLTFYADGRLKSADFVHFELTHFKEQQYKLLRK